jgi:hypothetical protein
MKILMLLVSTDSIIHFLGLLERIVAEEFKTLMKQEFTKQTCTLNKKKTLELLEGNPFKDSSKESFLYK